MKRWGYWIVAGVVLLAMVALIGWARAYVPMRTPSASEEWSRGRLLGVTSVSVRVDLQTAPDGGVFLSWVDLADRLHVGRLGTRGQSVADWTPALGADVPREPHFLVGPEGEIHLIWRETGEERSLLTYALLSSTAAVQAGPLLLSLAGDSAQSPSLAFNRRGEVEVFWAGQAGIYQATLSAEGKMQGQPVLLVEDGESVAVQVDQEGIFHLAWLQEIRPGVEAIYYASLDPERKELSQPEEMTRLFLRLGQAVESLVIGLDTDTGYVLWVVRDMKYTTSSAQYVFFPLEIPRQKKVRDVQLDIGGDLWSLGVARGQYETLLVALSGTMRTSGGPELQVGIMTLRGGSSPGAQAWATLGSRGSGNLKLVDSRFGDEDQVIVTASDHPSLKPGLVVDAQDNLHLTWLETGGFGVYRVAYASTAPEVKEAYNRLTVWDVTDRALGIAVQFFTAVGLTPVLTIYWSLFPLGWLLLYLLVTGNESLTVLGARVALGVSVLLEVVSTYLIYPHRSRMSPLLQWTVPPATAAVALLLAVLYLWRRDEKPLFGAFFMFAIVHGLLQVMCFVFLR